MKKIINDPSNVVPEMLAGLVKAYPDYVTQLPDTTVLIRSDQASMQGKVGLVSGGGSGRRDVKCSRCRPSLYFTNTRPSL